MKARIHFTVGQRFELFAWLGLLIGAAFIDPAAPLRFSLCLFNNLGVPFCPGCGLGRSIAHLFRGDLAASFLTHPMGLPAVLILGWRIITLARNCLRVHTSALVKS